MGWTTTNKPKGEPVLDFFIRKGVLRWSDENPNTYRVLDSAIVNFREFYAAIERINKATGERIIWAAVILIEHRPKDPNYNFGWKDMDESVQPFYYNCPARILDLLTPTENESSNCWRKACRDNIEKRKIVKNLPAGTVLEYGTHVLTVVGPHAHYRSRLHVKDQEGRHWGLKHTQAMRSRILHIPQASAVPDSSG